MNKHTFSFVVRFFIVTILFFNFISCNYNPKSITSTYIKIKMEMAEGKAAIFRNTNPGDLTSDTLEFDNEGIILYPLNIAKPNYYSISIGRTQISVFIKPGDSVLISGQINNLPTSIIFGGTSPVYNNYLFSFNTRSNQIQDQLFAIIDKPESEIIFSFDSMRTQNEKTLLQLSKSFGGLDPYFLEIEKSRILIEWAGLHLFYPQFYYYAHRKAPENISQRFNDYLNEVNFSDSSLTILPSYGSFLNEFILNESEKIYSSKAALYDSIPYILCQLSTLDSIISDGFVKSSLAYRIVKEHVTYNGIKDFESYFYFFKQICNYSPFISDIEKSLEQWAHLKPGMPAKDFSYPDFNGKLISLSNFKGSWVFIDVWASWCSPCMAELPYLLALEKKYSSKGIVFISISVDSEKENWINVLKTKKLQGVQLWSGPDKQWKEFYKINGIPRFMIIDPEGNFYQSSADNPSNRVDRIFDDLLNL